jgi:hypothetical protein
VYDRLYVVVSMTIKKNGNGAASKRLKFDRVDSQDSIKFNKASWRDLIRDVGRVMAAAQVHATVHIHPTAELTTTAGM